MAETCARNSCGRDCLADGRPARSVARAAGRLALALSVLGAATALVPLAMLLPGHRRQQRGTFLLQLLSRAMLRAIGVRVERRGFPASGPCLVVANHVSWLDVLVLTAQVPMVPVAKSEVAGWPLLGPLAARLGTLFIRRGSQRELPATVAELTASLRRGHRVQVFPESTTRCGASLLRFRRAAFQAAVDAAVVIAPAALSYRRVDGSASDAVAFVGDDDLLAGVWRMLRGGPVSVQVQWLGVIPAGIGIEHRSRSRALAAWRAEHAVASALGQPVVDRPPVRRAKVPDLPRPPEFPSATNSRRPCPDPWAGRPKHSSAHPFVWGGLAAARQRPERIMSVAPATATRPCDAQRLGY